MDYICMYRIQDLQGRDDETCKRCWRDSMECNGILVHAYIDRDDCMDEFLVTEEEFDEIERKRRENPKRWEPITAGVV